VNYLYYLDNHWHSKTHITVLDAQEPDCKQQETEGGMKGSLKYKIIPSFHYVFCDASALVIFTLAELSLTVVDFCSQL